MPSTCHPHWPRSGGRAARSRGPCPPSPPAVGPVVDHLEPAGPPSSARRRSRGTPCSRRSVLSDPGGVVAEQESAGGFPTFASDFEQVARQGEPAAVVVCRSRPYFTIRSRVSSSAPRGSRPEKSMTTHRDARRATVFSTRRHHLGAVLRGQARAPGRPGRPSCRRGLICSRGVALPPGAVRRGLPPAEPRAEEVGAGALGPALAPTASARG